MLCMNILMIGLRASVVSATPVVDGVISPGEYYGGMSVQLVGRTDPNWTVSAYIAWDTEYLYVAVNESVPATTGHISWIEFAIDAGPARSYLDAFVLFDDHVQAHDQYVKPAGHWSGQGTANFTAVSNVATEFMLKYTDYGIAIGDTIKMSIDRNLGPPPSPPGPPYGFSAFWPENATVYDGTPIQADPTTWGDVYLSLPPIGHVVDGIITQGEYNTGMALQLVGRTDPNFTVAAYVDWDTEFLYVAVNEPVPATTDHKSWIEFAIDAGPARSYLDAFVLFDDNNQSHVIFNKPSGPWYSQGPSNFSAVSHAATEFKLKYADYGIALGDTIKMSIDRNQGPPPPAPYGFAAFWPQNATVYDGIPIQADTSTWGDVYLAPRDVAVTNVMPAKTIVGRGYTTNITVATANLGGVTETFNTLAFANLNPIALLANTTLAGGDSKMWTFNWNTTGLAYGNSTMSAAADTIPGETDITNNNYTAVAAVHIGVPGDISGSTLGVYDGMVNMRDIAYLVSLFNTKPASLNWNPNADINDDGTVNMKDIAIGILNFNQHE